VTTSSTDVGPAAPSDDPGSSAPIDREATAALVLGILGVATFTLLPAMVALWLGYRSERRIVYSRGRIGGRPRVVLAQKLGRIGIFTGIIGWIVFLAIINHNNLYDVQQIFFRWDYIRTTFPEILDAFWLNVQIFVEAEILVLIWGLMLALMRMATGPAAPLKWFAIAYVDIFRGLPGLVTILLIVDGSPIAHVPFIGSQSVDFRGVIALTIIYGAYVAEVYRAGIESVHWSQAAAARSLGLTQGQAMGHVVVPQAVRRVVPPLLNDFIGLQRTPRCSARPSACSRRTTRPRSCSRSTSTFRRRSASRSASSSSPSR
jgi:polar amino acid transport system permease protein